MRSVYIEMSGNCIKLCLDLRKSPSVRKIKKERENTQRKNFVILLNETNVITIIYL